MQRSLLASLLLLSPLSAQDMIGVTWSGQVIAFDSFTGVGSTIGTTAAGMNSLARDDGGTLWTVRRPVATYELAIVDPGTGTSIYIADATDTRGLAWFQGQLYAALQNSSDELAVIDIGTGQATVLGSIGANSVQSLCAYGGTLYAWDLNQGLLTVDPVTGAGTDVNPSVGGGPNLQWLAQRSDGRLVGGNTLLYEVDPVTGVATLIGGSGLSDMRGAEPLQDFVLNFGVGCNGAGGPVSSSASIGGGLLSLQSTNHAANAIGLVVFGASNTITSGVPLPVSLDPVLGTANCSLYVSLDVSLLALTGPVAPATLDLQVPILPGWAGFSLFAQHAVLENVPGGLSMSDAVLVQFGF